MNTDSQFIVIVPEFGEKPIKIFDHHAEVNLAVVDRDQVHQLDEEWDASGVCLLLGRHAADATWNCHVGKGSAGLRERLENHLRKSDHWYRAVLIRHEMTDVFDWDQSDWFEERLEKLFEAPHIVMISTAFGADKIEAIVGTLGRVLRLLGHDPARGIVEYH